jgi:hypothetical protein
MRHEGYEEHEGQAETRIGDREGAVGVIGIKWRRERCLLKPPPETDDACRAAFFDAAPFSRMLICFQARGSTNFMFAQGWSLVFIASSLSVVFLFGFTLHYDLNAQTPATKATPTPTPNMSGMDMNRPKQSPTPSASPERNMGDMKMGQPERDSSGSGNAGPMNMGPLLVMSGADAGIKVGPGGANVLPMGQMGSGTSWLPVSTPMYMMHKQAGGWLLIFHYALTAGINSEGGPRGATNFDSANWFMGMAYHLLGKGTIQLRGMMSLEPLTFPRAGSPLLFQTGESYRGRPLIDRQHPHDLFMELSATYTLPLGERATWFTYVGYPGEPALGPPAFMHRLSAAENPSATLAHHLEDSTHISFGVLTSGFTYRWLKLEGSVFNGREPDENRYNFEAHPWNSRSLRFSVAPNQHWAIQASYGFLRGPEVLEPDADIHRLTASVQNNQTFSHGNLATTFVWGRNHISGHDEVRNLNGYTVESTVNFLDHNYVYARLELVDKDELLRAADLLRLGINSNHPSFRIGAFTVGGARDVWTTQKASLAVGSDLTFYSTPNVLDLIYGSHPISWKLFLRLRPGKMSMREQDPAHQAHQ